MASSTIPLVLSVDRRSRTALPVQVAEQVRAAVRAGTLRVGDRLPSTRALAREVGVSRAVVEHAYDQLHAEGWVSGRHGSGTYVHDIAAGVSAAPRRDPDLSVSSRHTAANGSTVSSRPLTRLDTGKPWRDPRLDAGWRRAWRDVSAARPPIEYPDPAGLAELREAVAEHVSRHRGIACTPAEVMITNGTTHAMDLLLQAMPAGTLAIEDPGYRSAAATALQRGWRLLDVPVDGEGIDVAALQRSRRRDIRAIYVTPAHQHPLGMTLTPVRRRSLLQEAVRRDALVLEDDYDSEFRYDVAPLPALAQLGLDRVAYLGTASKSVLPGLRLGWLVTTEERVAAIATARVARHDHPNWPVQRAFVSMLRDGYVDRLLRSARRVYAERSREVDRRLAPYGHLAGGVAGMYTVLRLPPDQVESVVSAARTAGFDLPSLAEYARASSMTGIVLGFGAVSDRQLDRALDAIESALRG